MSAPISTHVVESAVSATPIQKVWSILSKVDFAWWKLVTSSSLVTGTSFTELDANIKIHFKDGASWVIAVRELSSITHSITFEIIECTPASSVTSTIHTISLKKITNNNSTFIEWVTDFSSDATAAVTFDSSYKRHEAFNDLIQAAAALA